MVRVQLMFFFVCVDKFLLSFINFRICSALLSIAEKANAPHSSDSVSRGEEGEDAAKSPRPTLVATNAPPAATLLPLAERQSAAIEATAKRATREWARITLENEDHAALTRYLAPSQRWSAAEHHAVTRSVYLRSFALANCVRLLRHDGEVRYLQ